MEKDINSELYEAVYEAFLHIPIKDAFDYGLIKCDSQTLSKIRAFGDEVRIMYVYDDSGTPSYLTYCGIKVEKDDNVNGFEIIRDTRI